ncbi:MAG: SMC-Scp complex subunit ScpB [Pseudomonadota bacterium]
MNQAEPEALENAPDAIRNAVKQLSFAYSRSEQTLSRTMTEKMADAMRRAEAVLFAAGVPLDAEALSEILPQGVEAGDVLMALKSQYEGRGVLLVEVAGKWRFQSAPDLEFLFVEERQEQKKLSQAALETLAIIAYGQPVTRAEIEAVRGVAVSKGTIDTLLEMGWIRVKGRRKTPGRPATYGTTDGFLEHFGLESLAVLPGKTDLEAEGLLCNVMPDDFRMPGEEGRELERESHQVGPAHSPELDDESAFITDFMDEPRASIAE